MTLTPRRIDRIDHKGNITEHWTLDGLRTVCGHAIENDQPAGGNRPCQKCAAVMKRNPENYRSPT